MRSDHIHKAQKSFKCRKPAVLGLNMTKPKAYLANCVVWVPINLDSFYSIKNQNPSSVVCKIITKEK